MLDKNTKIISTAQNILQKYWGYSEFRALQGDIIQSVLDEKDTMAIMPTGGGKSVCFQVPGLIREGICIVVSPLIALMKDQVFQLQERGIAAAAIYSGLDSPAITDILNDAIDDKIRFLYLSPERLKTYAFQNALKYLKIGLLAIDEAHCISKWGYDFRPSYLDIAEVKEIYQGPAFPTIALTATATEQVRKDISEKLSLKNPQVFVKSFARDNLSYIIKKADVKEYNLLDFLKQNPGSSIIYAKTRKRTMEIASFLTKNGISCDYYHAGLPVAERNKKQETWIKSPNAVMSATNAFGMGIDKADVRTVIHIDLCDNLEAYYQESGRAGRDGKPSASLLLFNENDILTLEKNLEKKYPERAVLIKVYQCLANYFQINTGPQTHELKDFDLYKFASTFGLEVLQTHYALKLLEMQKVIFLSESYFQPSKVRFLYRAAELLAFQERNPAIDSLVKTVLRMYGGEVFNGFVNIQENELASALGGRYTQTMESLNFLNKHNVIEYVPQKTLPQFSFLDFRYEAEHLPLNYKEIEIRKKNEWRALRAMANFATQTHICRMAYIQDYFDEKNPPSCGKCDVCKQHAKSGISTSETEIIRKKIRKNLPASITKLESLFSLKEKELAGKILQAGLASGKYKLDAFGLIFVAE